MELDLTKLKNDRGYLEGPGDAVDAQTAALVAGYKKNVCKNYISLSPEQIDYRLGSGRYHVTRKYDGELAVIFWNGSLFTINTGGKVRMGLPCMEDAARALQAAGIREAVIPAEMYVGEEKGRSRVFEVLAALADRSLHGTIHLAPFDIIHIDGEPVKGDYADIYQKLTALFGDCGRCAPVRCQSVNGKSEVKQLFAKWVEEEGGEGLVVRSELPLIYKIKPRYTIDVAVIGFSEGVAEYKGQIRSLLLAMMPEEGIYQIIGRTGNGFGDELKKQLLEQLTPKIIESKYIETDSNHVAFHMIKPETVIELSINDVLFESTTGPIQNPLVEIVDGEYRRVGSVNGISVIFPIFERIREDKACNAQDVRLAQIGEFASAPLDGERQAPETPNRSDLLLREVYKKEAGTKLMVQKFMVWKTNKESAGYPAYVFYYVNFSSERKDPLTSEIRISNSQEQIMELYGGFLEKNIKKGWVQV